MGSPFSSLFFVLCNFHGFYIITRYLLSLNAAPFLTLEWKGDILCDRYRWTLTLGTTLI